VLLGLREGVLVAVVDDVARLTAVVVRMHQGGPAEELRRAVFGPGDAGLGHLAKAAGVTRDQLRMFEAGELSPTTQQGLAWLGALHAAGVAG
jgi:hypothetical protein